MAISQRECDICNEKIPVENYLELIIRDNMVGEIVARSDLCKSCFNRLRSYIRHGMPKLSEIK